MATVDAATAGTAHGTLTANTAEVITVGPASKITVTNRGDVIMYGKVDVTDLTVAAQGTEAISPGETVTFWTASDDSASICLKSTGTPDYSVSRFALPRVGGGTSSGGEAGEAATETTATATHANVAGSASSVALFAANADARGRSVHNDSTAALYLKYGTAASTTSYKVRIDADHYFEFPYPIYTGVVHGIWASATGNARTVEEV
jgi:hypothetical protein